MKKITTHNGVFGPYLTIEILNDSYRCNGDIDLPFNVVGEGVIEEAEPEDFKPLLPKLEELQAEIVTATQQRLDDFARTRNYDGILSLCTYATSTNPTFAKEGQYGVNMRDATWAKLYEMLAEVEAGIRPVPTGYVDIEAELPVLGWPV